MYLLLVNIGPLCLGLPLYQLVLLLLLPAAQFGKCAFLFLGKFLRIEQPGCDLVLSFHVLDSDTGHLLYILHVSDTVVHYC